MGKGAIRIERYEFQVAEGKHFVDRYVYPYGDVYFNVRREVSKTAEPLASKNKLQSYGAPICQFVYVKGKEARAPKNGKANHQEKKEGEGSQQNLMFRWVNLWEKCNKFFTLVAVIDKREIKRVKQ